MSSSPKTVPGNRMKDEQRLHRSYNLAYIYFKNNEYQQAEKSIKEYVSKFKDNDKGFKLLGDILFAMNKRQEALESYEKSLELNAAQEDVLSNVCDLIPPDPVNVATLEKWASKAAKCGFNEVVDKFKRCIDAANASGFPETKKLNNVLQNLTKQIDRTPVSDKSVSRLNGMASSQSENNWVLVSPQVQGRDSTDGSSFYGGRQTMSTPDRLIFQKQQETLIKSLTIHQENVVKSIDAQQAKFTETTSKIFEAVQGNKKNLETTKKTLDVILKELTELKIAFKDLKETQKKTNESVDRLSSEFQNLQIRFDGGGYDENEDEYEDYGEEEYEDQNANVSSSLGQNQVTQPLNVRQMPKFDHLQISPSSQPQQQSSPAAASSTVFARLGTNQPPAQPVTTASPFTFGTSSTSAVKPIFGSFPAPVEPPKQAQDNPASQGFGFKFGGTSSSSTFPSFGDASKSTTGFTWNPPTEQKLSSTDKPSQIFGQKICSPNEGEEDDGGDDEEEEEHDPQFAPVIDLPNLVETKTGEEEEDIVYCHRAKLLRFDAATKQWKERGLGDLKILKHKEKNRFRIIMRREQVHKLACNHYLTREMSLKPMPSSDTHVCWVAMDYSDEEPASHGFAAKFKTPEILKDFKEKFEECQKLLDTPDKSPSGASVKPSGLLSTPKSSTSGSAQIDSTSGRQSLTQKQESAEDCQVVFVKEPEKELKVKAEKLSLPSNFYNYQDKKECTGCKGCEEDYSGPEDKTPCQTLGKTSQNDKDTLNKTSSKSILAPASFKAPPVSSSDSKTEAPGSFSFGLSSNSKATPVFGGGNDSSKNVNSSFVFGGSSKLSPAPTAPIFGGSSVSTSTVADKTPVFGSSASFGSPKTTNTTPGGSIFSSPNNFSWGSQTGTSKSIFGNVPASQTNGNPEENTSKETFGFKFGGNSSNSSPFAAFADASKSSDGFKWGSSSNEKASWQANKPAPIFGQKKDNEEEGDEEGSGGEDEEEHDPQFAPIISLPELVEVSTGEEDEEVIYSHRAKLFRYDTATKQWKERGLGDLKILKHKHKKRFRILMRREQVLKLACNHYLTRDMSLKPMPNSDTSVCWVAMDCSDDEPASHGFAVKFKNTEILNDFKEKFQECQSQLE